MNASEVRIDSNRPLTALPMSLVEAHHLIRTGQTTSVELTRLCLDHAEQLDEHLGVYIDKSENVALSMAERADDELAGGQDRGPLHGIPLGVKDNFAVAEWATTAQSAVMDPRWWHGRDATVVGRLREAGAVFTGKTSMNEFAIGGFDATARFPQPKNPWDLERSPAGSSSGSAIGVAAGFFLGSLGSDTGGSIRIPSAYCGVTGLKPTFGRLPVDGCFPLCFSLDHVGPIAGSAEDCAVIFDALDDRGDGRSVFENSDALRQDAEAKLSGLRIARVPAAHYTENYDAALPGLFSDATTVLEDAGATIMDSDLPRYKEAQEAFMVVQPAEILALHQENLRRRWDDYTPGLRILAARGALATAADYVQAQRVRAVTQQELAARFEEFDILVTPTVGTGAPTFAERAQKKDLHEVMSLIFTDYWNLMGNPVLTVPIGLASTGTPLGMQIVGRPGDEAGVLRVGRALQMRTEFHRQRPQLDGQRMGRRDV